MRERLLADEGEFAAGGSIPTDEGGIVPVEE